MKLAVCGPSNAPSTWPLLLFWLTVWSEQHFLIRSVSKALPVPHPLSLGQKSFLSSVVSWPSEPFKSAFILFLPLFMYISNVPCKSELKHRDSAVSPRPSVPARHLARASPRHSLGGTTTEQVGSPVLSLTAGGFVRCQ